MKLIICGQQYQSYDNINKKLITMISDVHFIAIHFRSYHNEQVLGAAEKLIAVDCFCITINQVDI
ncbi:MAG: hypothetical protein ACTS73_06255 [Arsenophonus sp. NEOnobi-MAG3]